MTMRQRLRAAVLPALLLYAAGITFTFIIIALGA